MLTTTLMRTKSQMEAAGITTATLAKICGISPSTLSGALRDLQYLGAEREALLLTTVTQVIELADALRPLQLPPNWSDLKQMLEAMRTNNVSPEQVRTTISGWCGREQSQ